LVFKVMLLLELVSLVVVQVVGVLSVVVLSLLDALHLVVDTVWEGSQFKVSKGLWTMLSLSWCSYSSSETGVVYCGGSSFAKCDRMDFANSTFEEMPRHRFDSFGINPSVESFARSHFGFELQLGGLENIWLRLGVVLQPHPGGVKEEHHIRGWWTRTGDF
jgi:hypothetical protein